MPETHGTPAVASPRPSFLRRYRGRLLVMGVGAAAILAIALFVRPAPDRLQGIVAARLLTDRTAEIAAAVAALPGVAPADGPAQPSATAGRPTVDLGPCGAALGDAVDAAGVFAPAAPPAGHVACRCADDAVAVVIAPTSGAAPAPVTLTSALPTALSIVPPLLAILLAITLRHVLIALGAAVWLGATFVASGNPAVGLWSAVRDYAVPSIFDNWKMFLFTVSLMGMVNVIVRSGGVKGLVDIFARRARGVRSTQLVVAGMGTAVFFDDYANSVVVGAAARPLTDAMRISREKLAYLVDSTAAPIAGIAVISTWIGIELQLLGEQLRHVPGAASAYDLFFQIVPYRFYCLFAIAFLYLVVLSKRDFGPMRRAEERARTTGAVLREGAIPLAGQGLTHTAPAPGARTRARDAILPVVATLSAALAGFFVAAYGPMDAAGVPFDLLSFATWRGAFVYGGDASSTVLALAGVTGSLVAIGLAVMGRAVTLTDALVTWVRGVWAMRLALMILVLAHAIRFVTDDLGTAPFLAGLIGDVSPVWLPILSFLLAAVVSFSTGTSWGTMGILLPVVVPLVSQQMATYGAGLEGPIMLLAVASVLDGAIFGDHCSPISDTTVLSSMATASDHMDHVRTQAPYALLAMLVAGVVGYGFTAWFAWPWWVVFPLGLALLAAVLYAVGREARAAS